jgi:hypothetical protein
VADWEEVANAAASVKRRAEPVSATPNADEDENIADDFDDSDEDDDYSESEDEEDTSAPWDLPVPDQQIQWSWGPNTVENSEFFSAPF